MTVFKPRSSEQVQKPNRTREPGHPARLPGSAPQRCEPVRPRPTSDPPRGVAGANKPPELGEHPARLPKSAPQRSEPARPHPTSGPPRGVAGANKPPGLAGHPARLRESAPYPTSRPSRRHDARMNMPPVLRWLTFLPLRYPRTLIAFWTAFFIVTGFFALQLPSVLKDHGLTPENGAYAYVKQVLAEDFRIPDAPVILVFEKEPGIPDPLFRRFIGQTLDGVKDVAGLSDIWSPLQQEGMLEGNYAYALLAFEQRPYEMEAVLTALRDRLPRQQDMSVAITGKAAIQEEVNRASRHDLEQAELLGLPAAFLILWLAFGGWLSAMLPVIMGMLAVTGTMGILYGVGMRIELSSFVLNVVPMVGLALCIDFALMVVSRFREELGGPRACSERALRTAMATAGKAVLFSAGCVLLGLAGVLWIPLPLCTTVAISAMAVVAVSTLVTFTLLPALLVICGPALEQEAKRKRRSRREGGWGRWADTVMKRPVRMLILSSLLLLACLLPLKQMNLAIPDAASLPEGNAARQAMETYQTRFEPFTASLVYMVVRLDGGGLLPGRQGWEQAYRLVQHWEADPAVKRVDSVFSQRSLMPEQLVLATSNPQYRQALAPFFQHGRLLVQVTLHAPPGSAEAMEWVRTQERMGRTAALPYYAGGEAKYEQEVFDAFKHHFPKALFFIIVSNYAALACAFRSVLLPVKALAMNFLSLGAAFGLLTHLFQQGGPGIEPNDIAIMIPLFIFGLVFGISMDYGVFLLSRVAESYERSGNNEAAIREGLVSTSGIITSAAAIMIAVTAPFAFGEVVGVKQLGIGIATAIAIDATLIRLVVVPSLMKLMEDWNWWAPWRHARVK